MSDAAADTAPAGHDRDPLFAEVVARLPLATGPDQMERLVVLALRMILRRDEDREQLDRVTRSIHESLDEARRRSQTGESGLDLHRIGQQCARLLDAAERSRPTRPVVLHPAHRARSEQKGEETPAPPHRPRRHLSAPLMAMIATLLFLPAAAIAIDPSLAPPSWRSPPVFRLTASGLAQEIAALPAGDGSKLVEQGIHTHLARRLDDRPLVIVDNLPRRLCPKTTLLLAKQGEVTIFGHPAPDALPSTLASLCHGENGDARVMWTPSPSR